MANLILSFNKEESVIIWDVVQDVPGHYLKIGGISINRQRLVEHDKTYRQSTNVHISISTQRFGRPLPDLKRREECPG